MPGSFGQIVRPVFDAGEWTGDYEIRLFCPCMRLDSEQDVIRHWNELECIPLTRTEQRRMKAQHHKCAA